MAVNLLFLFVNASPRLQQKPFLLPSLLHLVISAHQQSEKNRGDNGSQGEEWLKGVGAMLGCPIVLADDVVLEMSERKERDIVLLSSLAATLWFQQLIERFVQSHEIQIRYKVASGRRSYVGCSKVGYSCTYAGRISKARGSISSTFRSCGHGGLCTITLKNSKIGRISRIFQCVDFVSVSPFCPFCL